MTIGFGLDLGLDHLASFNITDKNYYFTILLLANKISCKGESNIIGLSL